MMYPTVATLPFRKIYGIDFEYCGKDGAIPEIVCMVVQDLNTNEVSRYWATELYDMSDPPFETGEDVALITYFAPAEVQSMLALQWSIDVSIIDLFAEFRCYTNGDPRVSRRGLVHALDYFGLTDLIPDEKEDMRTLILSGGPWSKKQRVAILDYCTQDVICLGPLLNCMLQRTPWMDLRLNHALIRGRYMKAVGSMQHRGIPIDLDLLDKLNANWDAIKLQLIESVDAQYGVYVDGSFKEALFQSYLARAGIPWPRLHSGRLALDRDTFSDMSKRYPNVQALHASCVVFNRDGPLKSDYRRYNIDGITGGDDYAAMAQVLARRYKYTQQDEDKIPDIVFIDGGKGQLGQAEAHFEKWPYEKKPLLIGVAKGTSRKAGLETLILAGSHETIPMNADQPGLHLIQHIRDESHRFAIAGHRNRRQKIKTTSTIESIPGVGAKRRQALLKYMGGLQGLKKASQEEIQKVPGISVQMAEIIYDHLHS